MDKSTIGAYLRVLEAQFLGELLTVRLADVLLQLEPFLEAASLEIRENGSPHHPPARLAARVRRPWENQTGTGEVADTALNGARKHGASARCAGMVTSGAGASDCRWKAQYDRHRDQTCVTAFRPDY